MTASLRLILGDQLSHSISSLSDCDKSNDIIFMAEVWEEASYVKHHKKKIAFLFSAMRHFAIELEQKGYKVIYTKLDDPDNAGSFTAEVARMLKNNPLDKIVVTFPGEYRVLKAIESWQATFNLPVEIREDSRFLSSPTKFANWARGRTQLRMEYFYRELRQEFKILMDGDKPAGGEWNYDANNRKPIKSQMVIPVTYQSKSDAITEEVLSLVEKRFASHFGDLYPFHYGVTRIEAIAALELFIEERLCLFGDYQDAMLEENAWLFHSHLSLYLNCGLLLPMECIKKAEEAYTSGKAPLNSVEGFIRQIMGWREYVRGVYWLKMPDYAERNFFLAKNKLPDFYWTTDTKMNCLRQCITDTKNNAYAHHIQRLMVLGNFALLAGIDPKDVNEWFLIVYADAYEWVELPNVSGMILFADGGYLASKPYAASGSYINKMSNYCKNCSYDVKQKNGSDACPFNYLYWHFLARNRDKLATNPRLGMIYRTYDQMDADKKAQIEEDNLKFIANMYVNS
ncbi:cryptochrome/photolyase family protein [Aquella oligotrophica]|uniref:Cryptochrome/photolyase family protein n=1 Tax=Aquella oligotrophica TaxID=2067065 RepID=A0A2I7N4F1_9NEIS|nr:cryptochrome/photolyase family protein [Aquella oligotrophica]AUR51347.1 cryptochrome/photolyase family protein [Aquella oligotrophica]